MTRPTTESTQQPYQLQSQPNMLVPAQTRAIVQTRPACRIRIFKHRVRFSCSFSAI